MTKKNTAKQKTLESAKALKSIGLFFTFMAIITLPAAPLISPLFCKRNSANVCTLDSSLAGIQSIITLITIFGLLAIILLVGGAILRMRANNTRQTSTINNPLKIQKRLESAKSLISVGVFFVLIAVLTYPVGNLLMPLYCKTNGIGACTLASRIEGIYMMYVLIAIFSVLAVILLVAGWVYKIRANVK